MAFDNKNVKSNGTKTEQKAPVHRLPEGYLKNGYFDERGAMNIDYIIKIPKNFIGKDLTEEATKNDRGKIITSYNKIRGFYDSVVKVKDNIKNRFITADQGKAELSLVVARVFKRCTTGAVSPYFRDFIARNVEYVTSANTDEDFKKRVEAFAMHYEAVVGFVNAK